MIAECTVWLQFVRRDVDPTVRVPRKPFSDSYSVQEASTDADLLHVTKK